MVAACVLPGLNEPLSPLSWWSEWPRPLSAVDPLDGLLSPKDTAPPAFDVPPDTRDVCTRHEAHGPPASLTDPAAVSTPLPALSNGRPDQCHDDSERTAESSGETSKHCVPARPANFVPPFLDTELSVPRRPRQAVDLTGPHPRQPPPASCATPPPDRRKRRYASGELYLPY